MKIERAMVRDGIRYVEVWSLDTCLGWFQESQIESPNDVDVEVIWGSPKEIEQ
jgi:hypothetical protein